nr:TMEM165/GDT1 family protein [Prochlorococcus sp. MIT 1341]
MNDGFLTVFLTTFTTVFIAEIGDKTQLATLLLSAQSGRPLIVFLGAALALISASLVGVLVGRWLSTVVSPEKFQQISGLLFIVLGVWLATQAFESMLGTI